MSMNQIHSADASCIPIASPKENMASTPPAKMANNCQWVATTEADLDRNVNADGKTLWFVSSRIGSGLRPVSFALEGAKCLEPGVEVKVASTLNDPNGTPMEPFCNSNWDASSQQESRDVNALIVLAGTVSISGAPSPCNIASVSERKPNAEANPFLRMEDHKAVRTSPKAAGAACTPELSRPISLMAPAFVRACASLRCVSANESERAR